MYVSMVTCSIFGPDGSLISDYMQGFTESCRMESTKPRKVLFCRVNEWMMAIWRSIKVVLTGLCVSLYSLYMYTCIIRLVINICHYQLLQVLLVFVSVSFE